MSGKNSFLEIVKNLETKEENQGYIILIRCGAFFISIGANTIKHCKRVWNNYYIIKMDVAKYFQNIDKQILYKIIARKIKDENLLWLTREILYFNGKEISYTESEKGFIQVSIETSMCENKTAKIRVRYLGTNEMIIALMFSIIAIIILIIIQNQTIKKLIIKH